ncbi:MAG: hypothetical protein JW850_01675 [Thermoflexales bacterium]|nr:hypothetical protein [Thermoflexales bacterium]
MFRKNEQGQAIVILAIGMVVLLIFAALAIDAGNAYTAKREAQNAADAVALAGTRQLAIECNKYLDTDPNTNPVASNITGKAAELATANDIDVAANPLELWYLDSEGTRLAKIGSGAVPCGCGPGAARGVEGIVSNPTQSFLAGIMGQDVLGAKASAKARYAQVGRVSGGLYPLTRIPPTGGFVLGEEVIIRDAPSGEESMPGNFGWLTWAGSPDANQLEFSMTPPGDSETYINPHNPNDHSLDPGDWVEGATGNMAALKKNLDQYWVNTGRIIVFPLFDAFEGVGSNGNYRVVGYGALEITGYNFGGSNKDDIGIHAVLTPAIVNGDWATSVTCENETGVYSIKLTP